jgi:nitroreductase
LRRIQAAALKAIIERRSIRKFERKPVSKRILEKLVKAGQRAPSNCGVQPYSLIVVDDDEKRELIFDAIGRQGCMEEAPVWIIICCDWARPLKLFEMLEVDTELGQTCRLVLGIIDATLVAENVATAAEIMGLGSVFVGSVWKSPRRTAQILQLPANVLPILLLCIGYPSESPPNRPRWPLKAVMHENKYIMPDERMIRNYYRGANRALLEMNYFKKDVHSWAEHWSRKFKKKDMVLWEKNLREELKKMGFLP